MTVTTFASFAASLGLILDVAKVNYSDLPEKIKAYKSNDKGWNDSASHYMVSLTKGRKSMTIYYSQGSAFTSAPTISDILNCLASDYQEAGYTFEDFCSDFGYNNDSISDLRVYKAVMKESRDMERVIGLDNIPTLLDIERL